MTTPPAAAPPHLARLADAHTLAPGDVATVFAALRSVRHGLDRNGAPYLDLTVADASAKLPAKIWGDSRAYVEAMRAELAPGCVAKLMFTVGSYRDALQLSLSRVRLLGDDEEWERDAIWGVGWQLVDGLHKHTLVFDIETVPGLDPSDVPDSVAKAIAKATERNDGDEGKAMSLSPYFGKVVSLAFVEGEREDARGTVRTLGVADPSKHDPSEQNRATVLVVPPAGREHDEYPEHIKPMAEADLLRSFWHLADAAELVVSFNGRGFDVPFLVTRSLMLGVPARVDLLSSPYSLRPHLDLYRLLGHGRGGLGSTSLDVICWALGVPSPKGEMDGSMVAPTYARGDIESIATYNAADVHATAAVYRHLREHLLPFRHDW